MVDERGPQARLHDAGMTGRSECRYYGHGLHRRRDGAAARADRCRSAADPRRLVARALPAHPLVQARRRAQGHDGQGHHAGHAPRRCDRPAARPRDGRAGPGRSSSGRTPSRRCSRPRQPSTRSVRSTCAPSCAAPGKGSSGTSSSPATTISDTRPWSAPRCATPSTTATAGPSPCSASAPLRGSSPRATSSSGGRRSCARRTAPLVVDNPRFLILPWIEIPNLGSHILAIVRRRLPEDSSSATTPPPC